MQGDRPGYPYTTVCIYTTVNLNRCPQEVDVGVYGGMGLGALPILVFSEKLPCQEILNKAPFQWAYNVACSFPGL